MGWVLFIIYLFVVFVSLAINERYTEDHPEWKLPDVDAWGTESDYEFTITVLILWPILIPIFIVTGLFYGIYKCLYYVVDKIYTKILSYSRNINK